MPKTITVGKTEMIVKQTVREMFLHFGLNIDDPADIIAFQRDLQHLRTWRIWVEALVAKAFFAMILTAFPAAVAYLWLTFSGHNHG